jgi:hypothetical protein
MRDPVTGTGRGELTVRLRSPEMDDATAVVLLRTAAALQGSLRDTEWST